MAALGGTYDWVAAPLLAGAALLFLAAGARIFADPDTRALDLTIVLALLWLLIQLTPLPPQLVAALSPGAARLQDTIALVPYGSWRPLSIRPAATRDALALLAAAALVFWTAREAYASAGRRRLVIALAWMSAVVALVALVQHVTAPKTIYWLWIPRDPRAAPWGPFVNPNHLAGWLVMGLSLLGAYLDQRVRSIRTQPSLGGVRGVLVAVLSRGYVDLFCCAGLMLGVLALTLSRSGLVALGVAALVMATLSGRRRGRAVAAAAMVVSGAGAVAIWLNADQAVGELSAVAQSQGNRLLIWRETLPIIGDFAVAGTGAGTFPDAMLQYQRTSTFMLFNHAHNEYLNVLAEGGTVLLVLLVLFVVVLLRVAARRFASDGSTPHWSRIGALAGLSGIAAQSVWEFPLRTPANLLLAALCVALIALPTRRPAAAQ